MVKKLNFEFQKLTVEDLPLLCEWFKRPHLQKWWRETEITIENIREKYLPRIFDKDTAKPYLVLLNKIPIGYIQYYSVTDGNPEWWPDIPGPNIYGIDQFLADEKSLNQGIGTAMIKEFINFLKEKISVSEIRVDPHPDNFRAINCYKKVGFKNMGHINTPDGPAVMMMITIEPSIKKLS